MKFLKFQPWSDDQTWNFMGEISEMIRHEISEISWLVISEISEISSYKFLKFRFGNFMAEISFWKFHGWNFRDDQTWNFRDEMSEILDMKSLKFQRWNVWNLRDEIFEISEILNMKFWEIKFLKFQRWNFWNFRDEMIKF